ncbi:hypothetical protein HMPREF0476_1951 [Kingella kingae ATCC 23330]|uniref:Uncharacterized protein n=1 Tax=Kingella kingae ATCC 23330 TaxID=887327 RepID=F5S9R8_KINKI|nr:hypothetical protein HMPREF0476_1951 [Kingella kingae ATCC 23330]
MLDFIFASSTQLRYQKNYIKSNHKPTYPQKQPALIKIIYLIFKI